MNWDALGAIAELVAAGGVIASLIYLAKQINANSENINQNTRALISDRDVSSNESALEILGSQFRDAELAAIVLKGMLSVEPLTEVEQFRYHLILLATFESHQTFFIQNVKGTVSNELWDYYSGVTSRYIQFPGVVKWWCQEGLNFNPEFADYIQKKMPDNV